MWWHDIATLRSRVEGAVRACAPPLRAAAIVHPSAEIDETEGAVVIASGSSVGAGAVLRGPIMVGPGCRIGNQAFLRGPLLVGCGVTIGFCTELKNALVGDGASLGPMCFVADSRIDEGAYLGALVRTSNARLDHQTVSVVTDGTLEDTGMAKLGCWIQERASIGIQTIILPGRIVARGSIIEPRMTITKNLPAGHYRVSQIIEQVG